MQSTNSWKLGLFVVIGAGATLAAFALLGARYLDRETNPLHMFFNEPIDGLTIGSEVRLRGMTIGNVVEVGAAPDNFHVQVDAQVFEDTLVRLGVRDAGTPTSPERFRSFLRQGMRAQLQRNALTGIAYVNIDFVDPDRYPAPAYPFTVPELTVPTIPSEFKGIVADIGDSLRRIPGTLDSVSDLGERVEKAIEEMQLRELSAEIRALAAALRTKLDAIDVAALQRDVHETLAQLRAHADRALGSRGTVDKLAERYATLADDLRGALDTADVEALTATARRTLLSMERAGEEVHGSVPEIRRAVASLRELLDMLQRDPGALIHGKTPARARAAEGGRR